MGREGVRDNSLGRPHYVFFLCSRTSECRSLMSEVMLWFGSFKYLYYVSHGEKFVTAIYEIGLVVGRLACLSTVYRNGVCTAVHVPRRRH